MNKECSSMYMHVFMTALHYENPMSHIFEIKPNTQAYGGTSLCIHAFLQEQAQFIIR